jgi:hypothetical protein
MSNKIKFSKYSAYFIAILVTYNTFGYLLLYFPAQTIFKHIVQKSIDNKKINLEDISVLAFKISDLKNNLYDFEWENSGKEFRFNGKMYDIEAKVVRNDTIYYSCYYDEKENILDELFTLHLINSKKESTQNSTNITFMFGLFFEELKNNPLQIQDRNLFHFPLLKIERRTLNYIKDTPTPPPRMII